MDLFYVNKVAINIFHNPVQKDRAKYVEIDCHFIKQQMESKEIWLNHVKSEEQIAYIVMKKVGSKSLSSSLVKLGIKDIYAPTWGGVWVSDFIETLWKIMWLLRGDHGVLTENQ